MYMLLKTFVTKCRTYIATHQNLVTNMKFKFELNFDSKIIDHLTFFKGRWMYFQGVQNDLRGSGRYTLPPHLPSRSRPAKI
jgi:hypothetical protein